MNVTVRHGHSLLDRRLLWAMRHQAYKLRCGALKGLGYIGPPSFAKGLRHLYAERGLGLFPGWRIEILSGRVDIGRDVRIGNNLLLNCGSSVQIGDEVTVSANVFIGTTDVIITSDLAQSFRDWPEVERPILIGHGCFIGFGAVILPGTVLGRGCVVGANAVVRGEFADGSVISGEKAHTLRVRARHP